MADVSRMQAFVVVTAICALPAAARAQATFGQVAPSQVVDFTRVGQNQTEPLKVADVIYQAIGFGNTFLVTTSAGNVIIDTSSAGVAQRHRELLSKVNKDPARYIILTHGHGDHTGGVGLWKQE